ncbi:F117A protein, partial [Amia calva]|nr:F117A protein [Amia calva]
AEKNKSRPPKPSIRRTLSLDTIIGPYLQGQWPKELDSHGLSCMNDKATQTPSSWSEDGPGKKGSGVHKRSASWGSSEHLREIAKLKQQLQHRSKHSARSGRERERQPPLSGVHTQVTPPLSPQTPLSRLTPRLRHSVEGLNTELEGVFVREPTEEQPRVLDVPDGHRAPIPPQRCSSSSQSDPSPAPLDPALLSPAPSPCSSLSPFPGGDLATDLDTGASPSPRLQCDCLSFSPTDLSSGVLGCSPPPGFCCPSPVLLLSSSPRPNKTCSFQREPPEGCERVRVCEESFSPCLGQTFPHSSCPDRNKVNFTPTGTAFCPVSLLKPLLPSMDFLFRSLSVSPVTGCSGGGVAPCQAGAVVGYPGPLQDSATAM